jgi:hypothetical protein
MNASDPAELLQSWGAGKGSKNETSIVFSGKAKSAPEAARIWAAFKAALRLKPELPAHLLGLPGMSGRKYRRFINRLIGLTPDAAYLEVGSWAGSTTCSAMAGNRVRVVCIDDWSAFGGPYEAFLENVARYKSEDTAMEVLKSDYRAVDYNRLAGQFNVYLYDGPHSFQDQYDGLRLAMPALTPVWVQIVDDWNWPKVRDGTWAALKDSNVEVLYSIEIRTTQTGAHADVGFQDSDWHNGYFLAACRKPEAT